MTQYFIHNGQNEEGPFDINQLKLQPLKKETPIWYEGLENWTTANEIEELNFLFVTKSTPPPLLKSAPPEIQQSVYASSNTKTSQLPKKKSLLIPIIIGSMIIIGLVGYQIYKNSVVDILQAKVDIQEQVLDAQENEEAAKETERQRINIANTVKNKNYRNNWPNYISAGHNSYTYRKIGGINGLEVVVTNNTEYLLDEVVVEVGYVKENGGYFKSETISVYNVPAKSIKSQNAPDSERGISVEMSISSIRSKKMHFCYEPGNWANNSEDPYFCK